MQTSKLKRADQPRVTTDTSIVADRRWLKPRCRSLVKRPIFLMGLLIAMPAESHVELKNNEFVFKLPSDWTQVRSDGPEQWSFASKEKRSSIVLSIVPKLDIPASRLVEVAKKFASLRREAEQKARPGQKVTFGDEWVELKPSGDVAEVAYAGYDETGMIFRFYGFVTRTKVLSLWVATSGRDKDLSKRAFDDAFQGLKFLVP